MASGGDEKNKKKEAHRCTQRKQQRRENWQRFWRSKNIPAFLWESSFQFVTWVLIGTSIGFTLLFFGMGNMRGAFWSVIALGISIVLMFAILADRHFFQGKSAEATSSKLSFLVVAETVIHLTTRTEEPNGRFWVAFETNKEVLMSPITDLIYVRFTNDNPKPVMIDHYGVDIRNPDGTWTKTASLDKKIGQLMMVRREQFIDIALDEPTFDRAVKNVSIISGGTVKGWLLIERPMGFDEATDWRLRIRDINNREGSSIIAPNTSGHIKPTETLSGTSFTTGNLRDVSHFRPMYYSDLLKQTGNAP